MTRRIEKFILERTRWVNRLKQWFLIVKLDRWGISYWDYKKEIILDRVRLVVEEKDLFPTDSVSRLGRSIYSIILNYKILVNTKEWTPFKQLSSIIIDCREGLFDILKDFNDCNESCFTISVWRFK